MEYAVVDKSKKRVSQEKDKPAAEYDDAEVENKGNKVSVQNIANYIYMYIRFGPSNFTYP